MQRTPTQRHQAVADSNSLTTHGTAACISPMCERSSSAGDPLPGSLATHPWSHVLSYACHQVSEVGLVVTIVAILILNLMRVWVWGVWVCWGVGGFQGVGEGVSKQQQQCRAGRSGSKAWAVCIARKREIRCARSSGGARHQRGNVLNKQLHTPTCTMAMGPPLSTVRPARAGSSTPHQSSTADRN
jgi:hypothetical protein